MTKQEFILSYVLKRADTAEAGLDGVMAAKEAEQAWNYVQKVMGDEPKTAPSETLAKDQDDIFVALRSVLQQLSDRHGVSIVSIKATWTDWFEMGSPTMYLLDEILVDIIKKQ
jgi:hypothetical protein